MNGKFCKNCKWSNCGTPRKDAPEDSYTCTNPAVTGYNIVTGELNKTLCSTARGDRTFPCGPMGEYFEARGIGDEQ